MSLSLTLRQLSYFVAVAEERHFRRAAERLHISQPPLTQRIQAMERDLGVQLFTRKGHVIELTKAGRLVLTEAQAALTQVARVREAARKAEQGEVGNLRIAVVISVPFIPAFSEAIKAFQHDYPGVVVDLVQTNSSEGIEALRQRKIDLCLVRRVSLHLDGLRQMTVARDRLMLVLPANHPKAVGEKIPLSDLAEERFILYPGEKRTALYGHIMDVWARTGLTPRIAQEAESGLAILALVAAGFGNAILPSTLSGLHMPNVVWRHIDMDERWTSSSIIMLHREESLSEILPSRFIDYVRQYSSETIEKA